MQDQPTKEALNTIAELPEPPYTIHETGLDFYFLVELVTKTLFNVGQIHLVELGNRIKLPIAVLDSVIAFIRKERLCEIAHRGQIDTSVQYSLTDAGRARAQDFLAKNQYAGPAPVDLRAYTSQVKSQTVSKVRVQRKKVEDTFKDTVINKATLDQLGAAVNSGKSIYLYGPAGSGKSFLASRLAKLLHGSIAIPYAVTVENEIIQIFDPLQHKQVSDPEGKLLQKRMDARWVLCNRPVIMTGGELTLQMLDLKFDPLAKFYNAPPQMKANGGVLLIDDFGRQLANPKDILNRWIVPLDQRLDFLALQGAKRFAVPFDVMTVFSGNISPSQLDDDAFIRRMGYKIRIGEISEQEYKSIFKQVCSSFCIPFIEEGIIYLLGQHSKYKQPLFACAPRDILSKVMDFATYEGLQPRLSKDMLERAWHSYFTESDISSE